MEPGIAESATPPEREARGAGPYPPAKSFRKSNSYLIYSGRQGTGDRELGLYKAGQRLGSARLGSARIGSARLGSAQLGLARLGLARLGSA